MERRNWWILSTICLLVAPITFALGRWSQPPRHGSNPEHTHFASERRSSREAQQTGETNDLSRVTIENLSEVEFDQAYELLRSAPKEALLGWTKRLEELPVTPRKTAAIKAFFKTLAQIDARTAVDLALGMDRADPRWTAIGAVAVATPAADLGEVARMYTMLDERKQSLVGGLVARWSETDPEATARFLAGYPGKVENGDIASVLFNWAALDPAAATAWLANADANRRDPGVYMGYYSGWVLRDRAAALTDLAARSVDETFEKAVKSVAEDLFADSKEAARAFILELPNSATQEAAVEQITGHITGLYLRGDYLQLKPDEVAKWLLTLPENLWQEQIGGVMDSWARCDDKPALAAWYNQLPPQMRDRLLAGQCRAYNWGLPTTGLQAGLRISDPELRQNTFREIFENMDEERRQEVLRSAELSTEEAAELSRILKRL